MSLTYCDKCGEPWSNHSSGCDMDEPENKGSFVAPTGSALLNAANAMRALLQRIWDEDEMGWLVGGRPHPMFGSQFECVKCGRKGKDAESVKHEDSCIQGWMLPVMREWDEANGAVRPGSGEATPNARYPV